MNHTGSQSVPETAEEYIAGLPEERAGQISRLRELILRKLPAGYTEEMGFGMITYVIPLETYPDTYNGHPLMYAALASQKRHMAVYLMNVYGDDETLKWFTERYTASGKKLDMGKSCVRFKRLEDLPIELIAETIARTPVSEYIAYYEASRASLAANRKPRRSRKQAE